MSTKQEVKSEKQFNHKEISLKIVELMRIGNRSDLEQLSQQLDEHEWVSSKLKLEFRKFIDTFLQRKSFSPEEMQERIEKHCKAFAKFRLHEINARARLLLASHYLATYNHFSECLQALIAVELIAQKFLGIHHMIHCEALFTKGSVYYFQGDYVSSTQAMVQAQSLKSFASASAELQFKSHVNLARNYVLLNEFDNAKRHVDLAEKSYQQYQGVNDKAALYIRKADLLRINNDWAGSLAIMQDGLEFYKNTQFKQRIAEFHKEIGEFFGRENNPLKDYESSIAAFMQAFDLAKELDIIRFQAAIFNSMRKVAYRFERWKDCSDFLVKYMELENQTHFLETEVHIKKLEEYAQKEKMKLLDSGKHTYNTAVHEEINQLREENESLKERNNHFEKVFSEIESYVENKLNINNNRATHLEQLHRLLEKGKRRISTLDAYLIDCEKTYPNFAERLVAIMPSITSMEMKVAKLIRMGLNTQSIATICGVTLKSIENHRMNLRKKCKLSQEQSLSSYIMALNEKLI